MMTTLKPHEHNWIAIILFGSRLYGTYTKESDYDYKIVYLPDIKSLVLNNYNITKSIQEKDIEKDCNLKIESEFMSLHKFISLAKESQIMAMDMLWAPETYRHDAVTRDDVWDSIIKNRKDFITKNLMTFVDYARNQAKKYGIKGSRIEAIKSCIDYIEKEKASSSYLHSHLNFFEQKAKETEEIKIVRTEKENFVIICNKMFPFNIKLKQMLSSLIPYYNKYGLRALEAKENKGVDFKAVSHAFRAIQQVKELVTEQHITFPLVNAEFLTDVKLGKYMYSYLEEQLVEQLEDVRAMITRSNLKEKPNLDWDDFILNVYKLI